MDFVKIIQNLAKMENQIFSLYLYGRFLYENSFYVQQSLSKSNVDFSVIDCREIFSQEDVTSNIFSCLKQRDLIKGRYKKRQGLSSFKEDIKTDQIKGSVVILFDQFQYLFSKLLPPFIKCIFKMHENISARILTVFVSSVPIETIGFLNGDAHSFCIYLSPPPQAELISRMVECLLRPELKSTHLESFCFNFYNFYYPIYNDFSKIIQHANFCINQCLAENPEAFRDEKNIQSVIKKIYQTPKELTPEPPCIDQTKGLTNNLKYLCIAAFIASFSLEINDKIFFSSNSSKELSKGKSWRRSVSKANLSAHARVFSLERLFLIYEHIFGSKKNSMNHIQHTIATAISLKYLKLPKQPLKSPIQIVRLRLNISENDVRSMSQSIDVNVNLDQYLRYT
ncbi:hypothetical protein HZS_7968 [Henneguya salminicola]|nr:hypothetical protein HZS_7968 [Henneguya salminicola]